mgnify:FL=1
MQNLISSKNKQGFTLAEVMITLGIIGIVAALTLSTLIKNTQNRELQVGLKKAYSTLSQALLLYEYENGTPFIIDKKIATKNTELLKKELIKNIKVAKDCGKGYDSVSSKACIPIIKTENEMDTNLYQTYNKKANLISFYSGQEQFVMNDNTLVILGYSYEINPYIFIYIDVNGFNKKPNRFGYDLFLFELNSKGKLLLGGEDGTFWKWCQCCSKNSDYPMNGATCTVKALSEDDYFKKLP